MLIMKKISLIIILLLATQAGAQEKNFSEIAFVADIHFMDIYAEYENFDGLSLPGTDKKAKIRTMQAQLHSTRLFNENYFVLKTVLDDIVKRGIKLVALPGDYTDDGQPVNVNGLREILQEYQDKYGIKFFITTGNHDPVRPYNIDAGKVDFLGENGQNQPVFNKKDLYTVKEGENAVLIEPGLQKAGYKDIMTSLADFGFFPRQDYLYWETPFSKYTPEDYLFKKAQEVSGLSHRVYKLNDSLAIPDASYLVEPVEGLWLLAIDGNTYVPQKNRGLSGAGLGYNNTLIYKKHLFNWIKDVADKAEELNKELIAFSHYPAVDFNEDASGELEHFLGKGKWQLNRVPREQIAQTLAKAGIKIHFAGHMHINDTGKRSYDNNNFLINIQTPSLAAYIPGYKILKLRDELAEIETISIVEVPDFNQLFPLYKMEHDYLQKNGKEIWDKRILKSENYHEFTKYHLENLVNLRFLPNDWPDEFRKFMAALNGMELVYLSQYDGQRSPEDFLKDKIKLNKIKQELITEINLKSYKKLGTDEMIMDFYKIRNADKLAFKDIGRERLDKYRLIITLAMENTQLKNSKNKNAQKLYQFLSIFDKFLQGLPANNFSIDMETGEILELAK